MQLDDDNNNNNNGTIMIILILKAVLISMCSQVCSTLLGGFISSPSSAPLQASSQNKHMESKISNWVFAIEQLAMVTKHKHLQAAFAGCASCPGSVPCLPPWKRPSWLLFFQRCLVVMTLMDTSVPSPVYRSSFLVWEFLILFLLLQIIFRTARWPVLC